MRLCEEEFMYFLSDSSTTCESEGKLEDTMLKGSSGELDDISNLIVSSTEEIR